MSRLDPPYGRAIDRSRPIRFSFEGREYDGFLGDTLASALAAQGVVTLARSFKYHRPRGLYAYGDLDAHALLQVGDEPNVAADRCFLKEGMPESVGQNRAGSLRHDWGAWPQLLKRFLPVGFYYRTFFSKFAPWPLFEPFIRAQAGLGIVRTETGHTEMLKQHLFCDVAVIGAGRAGLAAAGAAAQAGAEVLLIEAREDTGGFARACGEGVFGDAGRGPLHPNIRLLTHAVAQGIFDDAFIAIETPGLYYKARAKTVVLATGLAEQPLVFRGNDLPGVMLASAARKLLWLHGVLIGRQIALSTVNDHGLETALDLLDAGASVVAVTDTRPESAANALHDRLRRSGAAVYFSAMPYDATPALKALYFGGRCAGVRFAGADGMPITRRIACDTLLLAGGYAPMAQLACHAGAHLRYDARIDTLVLDGVPPGIFTAGSLNHLHAPDLVAADGRRAGLRAARAAGFDLPFTDDAGPAETGYNHPYPVVRHPKGGGFVEFDEDLTVEDVENAVADGFAHPEHLKRWSTANMGPSQGRHSALNVLRVLARTRGLEPAALGVTTSRPPTTGERFDRLAGPAAHPVRQTAMAGRHDALGAQRMVAGAWLRPAFYGAQGEAERMIEAEARAVREAVGLIDVSTLGKIELRGPDSALFLDRIYATPHLKQPVGKSRYALLCDETGAIVDDGVACRFAEDRFYITTTTGQADATYRLLTWLNAQWRMNVDIAQMTGAFAAVNLTGPLARAVLARVGEDMDLSPEAFPYLAVRMGQIAGVRARLMRVGFTGELGYEIHVPANRGALVWDALVDAGKDQGLKPFGVEAQRLLRLEKGHIIVGQDTDGLTTPAEAGLARALGKAKARYRGRAAHAFLREQGLARVLTGFAVAGTHAVPPENCLVVDGGEIAGRVTSAAWSATMRSVIGLAFVRPPQAQADAPFEIRLPSGELMTATSVTLPFYDPGTLRQTM